MDFIQLLQGWGISGMEDHSCLYVEDSHTEVFTTHGDGGGRPRLQHAVSDVVVGDQKPQAVMSSRGGQGRFTNIQQWGFT